MSYKEDQKKAKSIEAKVLRSGYMGTLNLGIKAFKRLQKSKNKVSNKEVIQFKQSVWEYYIKDQAK